MLPKSNEEASTSQLPLFQFTLPGETHQRREALTFSGNPSGHSLPPDASFGFSGAGAGFPPLAPTGVSSAPRCQRPLRPLSRAVPPSDTFPVDWYLLAEKLEGGRERKELRGQASGRRKPCWHMSALQTL